MLFAVASLLLVGGCASENRVLVARSFTVPATQEVLPILPFVGTLVPETFSTAVFDNCVDILNDNHAQTSIKWFSIIKDDLQEVTKALPPDHLYVSGELWSYIESSGCCSTELQVKARVRVLKAGTQEQLYEAEIPMSSFFEHDRSTLTTERSRLAMRLSSEMAAQILNVLKSRAPAPFP
ncbi:hypothetical protein [Geobacter argillaceus]|uniref:hypothetical protein n=1 Tax=Geobacter argillaceus TaxID=345631 RepID=UPI00119FAD42|nr:hypothetical protein [Geobacter argillaceus]